MSSLLSGGTMMGEYFTAGGAGDLYPSPTYDVRVNDATVDAPPLGDDNFTAPPQSFDWQPTVVFVPPIVLRPGGENVDVDIEEVIRLSLPPEEQDEEGWDRRGYRRMK